MTDTVPDLRDANAVLNYGNDAQMKIAEFSEITLRDLNAKDLGDVSGAISELIFRLQNSSEEKPGLFGRFRKPTDALKARYRKACEAVDKISLSLQRQRDLLLKDVEMLDLLYTMNREQYDALSACLNNGREALTGFREETLIPVQNKAEETEDPTAVQAARDASEQYDRFEKKLHDLELTRAVSLQMAPQIRLLQNNNAVMAEKIQSTVANTIPLWKSQMILALGTENSKTAAELQRKVSDVTDRLLRNNAARLKDTTLSVLREAERPSVSIGTLKETNELLIETFDEMLALREEGRRTRAEAEAELQRLDGEIRLRLLGKTAR